MKLAALAALSAALLAAYPAHAHDAANSAAARAETDHLMGQEMAADNVYRVYFPNAEIGAKAAISLHDNLLETNWKDGYLVVQLDAGELKRLEPFKFRIEKDTAFIAKRNAMLERLRAAGNPNILGQSAAALSAQGALGSESIPSFPCYETVEETYTAAQGLTTTYPTLAAWSFIGESWQKTQGLGGYDIGVLKLTNKSTTGPNGEAKPKLFLNSAIHAREYATAPLALAFARQLLTGYGTDADATWILDHHEVHLLLQTNPDGRKKAETGLSWRKNTNTNYCGATSNNRGADLNRNFSNSWNSTNGQGSSGNQCSETYRGPSAASEPETQTIEAYVRTLWPDRRGPAKTDAAPADTSGIHIDMHSYSELVLWPWGDTKAVAPNGIALQTLGRKFAYFNGYLPEASIGLYATDGTSDAISYGELGVAAFTIEMGTTFFQSCSSFESNIKPKNLPVLTYAAKVVRTPYLTPAGPDVTGIKLSGKAATTGVVAGTKVKVSAAVTDTRFSTRKGTEPVQNVDGAEIFVDTPPWMPGAVALPAKAIDGLFDSSTENVTRQINTAGLSQGKHMVFVRGRDADGNLGAVSASFLVIR
ncbi:MAG TPA: M14 family metallopeptidase [Ideonella sp.]|nr:M14 family metallopeptidase [Ideonella sp.]